MNKQNYISPRAEVIEMELEDHILTSSEDAFEMDPIFDGGDLF